MLIPFTNSGGMITYVESEQVLGLEQTVRIVTLPDGRTLDCSDQRTEIQLTHGTRYLVLEAVDDVAKALAPDAE